MGSGGIGPDLILSWCCQACCAASIDPDVALEMLCELSSAYFRDQSLLENEVHLMYLILLPVAAKDLVINISTYAGMVAEFCRKLGWTKLVPLLGQFQGANNMDVEGKEEEENTWTMKIH